MKRDLLSNSSRPEAKDRESGFLQLFRKYSTKPYPGKIAFFRADYNYSNDRHYINYIMDDKNGWESSGNGSIDVYKVPCAGHLSMINESYVAQIADALKAYL
jgi:thioesterase domain-containing protein